MDVILTGVIGAIPSPSWNSISIGPLELRAYGLMIALGMQRRSDMDFDHPDLPSGHPLRRHITYALEQPA